MKDSHTITISEDGINGTAIVLKLNDYNTYTGEIIVISPEAIEKLKKGMHLKDISKEEWFSIPLSESES